MAKISFWITVITVMVALLGLPMWLAFTFAMPWMLLYIIFIPVWWNYVQIIKDKADELDN